MSVQWSPQQIDGIKIARGWLMKCNGELRSGRKLSQPILRIFGFAGTGKTTLARHLADGADGPTCWCAFTGKAALMMQRSGCHGATTIHGLIYQVKEGRNGATRFVLDKSSPAASAAMIGVDECSMVDEELARDLMSFGRPILVLGDPAQLPPVKGAGYFINAAPDVMLTEIHRQARDSPIIDLATTVREGGNLRLGSYGASRVIERGVLSDEEVLAADQILVGKNTTRTAYNRRMRSIKGMDDPLPMRGDRLVCLRNDKALGIFNGGIFTADSGLLKPDPEFPDCIRFEVKSEDFPRKASLPVMVRHEFFDGSAEDIPWRELKGTQQFDFGYALTAHKAQGSQWPSVIAYDESGTFREDASRWLYTAITRAQDRITVVTDFE
jgi:exodeoxyribonuclease-5